MNKIILIVGVGILLYIIIRYLLLALHNYLEGIGLNRKERPIIKKSSKFKFKDPLFS